MTMISNRCLHKRTSQTHFPMPLSDHKFSKRAFVELLLNDVEQNLQSGQLHQWAALIANHDFTVHGNLFLSKNLESLSIDLIQPF